MKGLFKKMDAHKVGIIGCGDIAKSHLQGYQSNGVEIAAFADVDLEAAKKLAGGSKHSQCFTDYRDLIKSKLVDAVSICVPPCVHEEVAVYALEHGIHVLCEKPLAHSVQSAKNICNAAKRSNTLLMPAFRHRFLPAVRRIRKLIEKGLVGKLVMFHNVFCGPAFDMGKKWFSKKAIAGGGALMDTSSHSADLFRYLVGEVTEQYAVMHRHMKGIDVEDAGILTLKADNGAVGALTSGWVAGIGMAYVDIMGQNGRILYDYTEPEIIKIKNSGKADWENISVPSSNGFSEQISHFLGAVNRKHNLSCTCFDGLRAVEIIQSVYGKE